MSTTAIVILVAVAIAAALVISKRKKKDKPDSYPPSKPWVPPVLTEPTPIKPAPVVTPPEPVLLDRNRRKPGDPGYDPRAVRPDPEFSPIEPQGTF